MAGHSGSYVQALLVQSQERRYAENISESIGTPARALQRFLAETRYDDEAVTNLVDERGYAMMLTRREVNDA